MSYKSIWAQYLYVHDTINKITNLPTAVFLNYSLFFFLNSFSLLKFCCNSQIYNKFKKPFALFLLQKSN